MLNLQSLAKVAYDVMPKCEYQFIHATDVTSPTTLAAQLDERGFFIGAPNEQVPVIGIMSGITEQTLSWVPEGLSSHGFRTFSTETKLNLQGDCVSDVREGWILIDHMDDDKQYRVMSRRRRGCVYTYLLQLYCPPVCP